MAKNHVFVGGRYNLRSPVKRGSSWRFKYTDTRTGEEGGFTIAISSKVKAKKAAMQKLEEMASSQGRIVPVKFCEAFEKFLEVIKEKPTRGRKMSLRTFETYQDYYDRMFKHAFGHLFVSDLTYGKVEDWMNRHIAQSKKRRECGPTTMSKYITVFRRFCKWAKLRNYLDHDPTEGIELSQSNKVGVALTEEEVAKLLRVAMEPNVLSVKSKSAKRSDWKQEYVGRDHVFRYLLVAIYTGLRPGNIYDLTWAKHVNLEEKKITIEAPHMKSRKSKHVLPIHPVLLSHMHEWIRVKGVRPNSPVIGKKVRTSIKTSFGSVRKAAGLKVRPYDLRHTFATHLAGKCTVFCLQDLLHHSLKGVGAGLGLGMNAVTFGYVHPEWEEKVDAIHSLPDYLSLSCEEDVELKSSNSC